MTKAIKRIFKIIGFTVLALVLFLLCYFLAAFCLCRISIEEEKGAKDEVKIFITTNGVHTDIVVPVRNKQKDWSKEIKFRNIQSTDTSFQYVGIGWGDKGFYLETPTWAELKASVAFRAATGLSTTAIHASYFQKISVDSTTKEILISKEQYGRLIDYIDNSFQKDAEGHYIYIETDAVYGKTDAFYEAIGSYSMFHTCNTWTNKSLKICGQKAAYWTPFDTGIFLHYE